MVGDQNDDDELVWYFSYGSNMNPAVFEKVRGIKCREHRICRVPGYVLTYGEGIFPYLEPAFCTCVKRGEIEGGVGVGGSSSGSGSSGSGSTNASTNTTTTCRPDIHGVAFLITRRQYEHVLLTEGGWGYQEYNNDPFWTIGNYGVQEIDCVEIGAEISNGTCTSGTTNSASSSTVDDANDANANANANANVDKNKNGSINEIKTEDEQQQQQQQQQETVDTHNSNNRTATTTTTANDNSSKQSSSFRALTLVGLMGSRRRYDCNASQRYCNLVWVGAKSSGLPGFYRAYLREFHPPYCNSSGGSNNDYRATWGVAVAKCLFLVLGVPCLLAEIFSVRLCVELNDRCNGGGGKPKTKNTASGVVDNNNNNSNSNSHISSTIDTNRKWVLFRPPWLLLKANYLYRYWVLETVLQTIVFDWFGIPCGFRNNGNNNSNTTANVNVNHHGIKEE
eukprot:CAMPEP_0168181196 /NCGR_PEP_ID=MMETSP0139_2-20121125/11056_1 /TAXON_ID=44445 /ORGANISM="Pseudo-nitzschia australis, Strain 10249 10 AB" /LENGTH=449 /DNA_ID=CAMNT_0008101693 /DNA_START=305 /DNA_END=1654 /DNA_ORIENTATION=-